MASIIPLYDKSVSRIFAFRPSFSGEWASELAINVYLSRKLHIQFIGGSVERPISTAEIYFDKSSKHSITESNPDFEPNMENHGVQICAGTKKISSETSRLNSRRSLLSIPIIGLPSEVMLKPRAASLFCIFSTTLNEGAKIILCTFLTFSFFLYMLLISVVRINLVSPSTVKPVLFLFACFRRNSPSSAGSSCSFSS